MAYKDYVDLDIWQDGITLVTEIYKATKQFPPDERFGLTSQIQRAAVSIPSNIAEGYAQRSDPILGRHLRIAIGSAAEVDTQIVIASLLDYISIDQKRKLREQTESLRRRMRAFLATIEHQRS
jgi:four helix bundle protein